MSLAVVLEEKQGWGVWGLERVKQDSSLETSLKEGGAGGGG